MKLKNRIDGLIRDLEELNEMLHELAVSCLQYAQNRDLELCNKLIYTLAEQTPLDVGRIISWFEKFGKLKWNNKKGKLVRSSSGAWQIDAASRTNAWTHEIQPKNNITKSVFLKSDLNSGLNEIQRYLESHHIDNSDIGKFGLPADKNGGENIN